ncbi:hypothetical protein R3P38DRAFT_1319159 [Favolaschia claudopus]|uniref:Uncharacterized protein n=1 Tax=Favolaschia claudopus TaxID=2862362 RepID=A0AAW0AVE6_9AGAR
MLIDSGWGGGGEAEAEAGEGGRLDTSTRGVFGRLLSIDDAGPHVAFTFTCCRCDVDTSTLAVDAATIPASSALCRRLGTITSSSTSFPRRCPLRPRLPQSHPIALLSRPPARCCVLTTKSVCAVLRPAPLTSHMRTFYRLSVCSSSTADYARSCRRCFPSPLFTTFLPAPPRIAPARRLVVSYACQPLSPISREMRTTSTSSLNWRVRGRPSEQGSIHLARKEGKEEGWGNDGYDGRVREGGWEESGGDEKRRRLGVGLREGIVK